MLSSARNARHARPAPRRVRSIAIGLSAALSASLLVAMVPRAADANVCVLLPQLRDATVSQGIGGSASLPGYATLTRGKTTTVKAYLSKPQCATTQDRVKVTSASLQVSFDGSLTAEPLPTTITGPEFPELLNYGAAPALDAASDPVFSVPGSLLDGPRKDVRVTAAFTMTVKFEAISALGVPSTGTVTLRPGGAATGPTVSATFEKASNSPRLLVAIMGDPSKGFTHNWPGRSDPEVADGAEDVLLRALQAVSRIGPFKDGVVKDINGALGIRYTVAPTVLDVSSAIGKDGKFCGTSANFSNLRTQLSSFLNNWQAANTTTVVDNVLGVVWGPNSKGPAESSTCADGYAAVGGNQAWTRLTPDTASSASNAGNLIVMETVGHNFGSVPPDRDDEFDGYHSVLDAAAGSRGFNTSTLDPIPDAVSPLKYSLSNWDDYRTLLRREDWKYTLCRLTPSSQDHCPVDEIDLNNNTTPVGAPAGLFESVYTMAGKTDGTLPGTDIDTFLSQNTDLSDPSTTSEFRLVQRGVDGSSEPILAVTRFPVDFRTSEHHGGGEHEHRESTQGTLEVRFAAAPGAQIFEVYKGDPSTSAPIYRRQRDGAPVAGTATLTPGLGAFVNQTADSEHGGSLPALSPDGGLLAYTAAGGVVIKDLTSGATSDSVPASVSAWVDEDTIALVRDGSLYVRDVTRDAEPAFGSERTVYDSTKQVELFFAPANRPTADPAGTHLVTSISGDLWRIDLDQALLSPSGVVCKLGANSLAPCYQLTTGSAQDTEPAYESGTRVLFTRDGAIRAFDIAGGLVESGPEIPAAGEASASTPFVAYTTSSGLGLADASSLTVRKSALTTDADTSPSLVGQALAFARTDGSRTDVFTSRMQTNTLTFTATDDDAARLRANVYASCDGINYPIFAAAPPSTVTGSVATWTMEWDAAGSPCTEPALYAVINDGIDTARVDLGTGYAPAQVATGTVGAIYSPAPGSTVLQYDIQALLGDVPGVPAGELSWQVVGPGVDVTLSFVRGEPTLVFPPAGGWTDGAVYAVKLLRGVATLATGAFTAIADQDHDNIARAVEQRCFGEHADNDPTNASSDTDGDGYANVDDVDPCASSLNVTVDLDANALKTSSNGNTVTLYLTNSSVDLRTVPMSAIAATRIGNYDAHLPAVALRDVTATSATVKLDRQRLQAFVNDLGLTGYVPVILTGSGSAGSFRGFDPTDPTFS